MSYAKNLGLSLAPSKYQVSALTVPNQIQFLPQNLEKFVISRMTHSPARVASPPAPPPPSDSLACPWPLPSMPSPLLCHIKPLPYVIEPQQLFKQSVLKRRVCFTEKRVKQ